MKQIFKIFGVLWLLFVIALPEQTQSATEKARLYLQKTEKSPAFGNEWSVFALARSVPNDIEKQGNAWLRSYQKKCAEADGNWNASAYTDYARVALTLSALGVEPDEWIWQKCCDTERMARQGPTGNAFALLALQNAPQTDAVSTAQTVYVQKLLDAVLPDGGWCLSGDTADPDVTAIVLCALAEKKENGVAEAIENGLQTLSALQNENATFSGYGVENAESIAQVLIALSTLGISSEDARFCKNGQTLGAAILQFQNADGGFAHTVGGASQRMATVQALNALESMQRMQNSENALYDCSDVRESLVKTKTDWWPYFHLADAIIGVLLAGFFIIRAKRKKQIA